MFFTRVIVISLFFVSLVGGVLIRQAYSSPNDKHIHIDRKAKILYILNSEGKEIFKASCGVGRGGLKNKKSMADYVTPLGQFTVDLILYEDSDFNKIAPENINKYKDYQPYHKYLSSKEALERLFKNMNDIDFDRNGKSDKAYGVAYIGLDSKKSVTGPKMKRYRGTTPYWFSIALHGTPVESNIGKANSGGCIHLKKKDLKYLIEKKIVQIGTSVAISDKPPTR